MVSNMIFDMHFHTREGSIDGKVSITKALKILKEKGYDGVLVTDHNSYKGYNSIQDNTYGLTVLCGIEYDTIDGGHLLIILPDGLQLKELFSPGMKIADVIDMVHCVNGVVGLSHPFDCYRLGFMNHKHKNTENILKSIDFIEGANASSFKNKNEKAIELARKYNKPILAGSDSHRAEEVGRGRVEIPLEIKSNIELITAIKEADFNTFNVEMSFRKPSKFRLFLQFRVNIGGLCWYPYIKFRYWLGGHNG